MAWLLPPVPQVLPVQQWLVPDWQQQPEDYLPREQQVVFPRQDLAFPLVELPISFPQRAWVLLL